NLPPSSLSSKKPFRGKQCVGPDCPGRDLAHLSVTVKESSGGATPDGPGRWGAAPGILSRRQQHACPRPRPPRQGRVRGVGPGLAGPPPSPSSLQPPGRPTAPGKTYPGERKTNRRQFP